MKCKYKNIMISSFLQPSIFPTSIAKYRFYKGNTFLVIRLQDYKNTGLIGMYPYKRYGGLKKSLKLFKEQIKIKELTNHFNN